MKANTNVISTSVEKSTFFIENNDEDFSALVYPEGFEGLKMTNGRLTRLLGKVEL